MNHNEERMLDIQRDYAGIRIVIEQMQKNLEEAQEAGRDTTRLIGVIDRLQEKKNNLEEKLRSVSPGGIIDKKFDGFIFVTPPMTNAQK